MKLIISLQIVILVLFLQTIFPLILLIASGNASPVVSRFLSVLILGMSFITPASAETSSRKGVTILTVSGSIERRNDKQSYEFDYESLAALGLTRIQTSTPWTNGVPEFEGVLGSRLIEYLGAKGATVVVTALNDYRIEIPMDDLIGYPVLFALSMNGQRLTARDKGPVWIVYPRDQYAELHGEKARSRSVWQLIGIEFK